MSRSRLSVFFRGVSDTGSPRLRVGYDELNREPLAEWHAIRRDGAPGAGVAARLDRRGKTDADHRFGTVERVYQRLGGFNPQLGAGAEVVYAVRQHRDDERPAKQFGTRLFYRAVNRGARFVIPANAGDFRLMDRKVVLALRRLPERNRFMKGLYAWAGFRTVAIPYQPLTRESGLSNFNVLKLLHFAIDGMTAFTTWPLRVVTLIGLLAAVVAFVYGSWVVLSYLTWGNRVSGWSTLIVCILLFSGLQMMSLGVVGEYIARIFEEVKRRPVYIVSEEHGSGLPRKRRTTLHPLSGGANTVQPELPDPLPDDVTLQ